MTDNDIRGFLDGGFIWGWNQATQIHVRLGRVVGYPHPKYGENEVFRVLQRWEGVRLPTDVDVTACRLTLHVEEGPSRPLRVLVYAVSKDWNPGSGGVDENNVSVPKPGEVWWGDAAFERESWSHPGAGFASDFDPEADTGTPVPTSSRKPCGSQHRRACSLNPRLSPAMREVESGRANLSSFSSSSPMDWKTPAFRRARRLEESGPTPEARTGVAQLFGVGVRLARRVPRIRQGLGAPEAEGR
jgi:hypothetical protein